MSIQQGVNGRWGSRWTFILAAVGSAVGLGNIWKFPYITGENGGGAFVIVYLICISLIGIPIMVAEVLLGRRGRMSPINTMFYLAKEAQVSRWWSGVGWSGALAGMLILSFYSVVAGWSLHYLSLASAGEFHHISGEASEALFNGLLADVDTLVAWHTLFMALTLVIVAAGVVNGLGMAARLLMPALLFLLILLMVYSALVGNFEEATRFLFAFDFDDLTWNSILVALGHAFFTLSLGIGSIMAYGAYMPKNESGAGISLGKTIFIIAAMDTIVALMAGMVIFPIVFANEALQPGAGPGLLFVSLPVAFGSMPVGSFFASAFFLLIAIAALSSAISMIEPTVAWIVETYRWSRRIMSLVLGCLVWFVGLGSVFSFNIWSERTLLGYTFFGSLDFLTANIMLPLGGLFIAIFVGWVMQRDHVKQEFVFENKQAYQGWMMVLRYVSPVLLLVVFIATLVEKV